MRPRAGWRGTGWRAVGGLGRMLLLAGVLAGCSIPFGGPPARDEAPAAPDIRERHRLYLEEQERQEWQRQKFEPYLYPSER